MKLKLVSREGMRGAMPGYVLTTEEGELLPGQVDIEISQPFNDTTRITVTFVVDGDNIQQETQGRGD